MAETDDLIERGKRAIARLDKAAEEYEQTLQRLGYTVPRAKAKRSPRRSARRSAKQ